MALWGNHDYPYLQSSPLSRWGWTPEKYQVVSEILKPCHWKRLRLWRYAQGFLLSHAGVATPFRRPHASTKGVHDTLLAALNSEEFRKDEIYIPAIESVSELRGGPATYGGVVWQDWREFEVWEGQPQIVGHTIGYEPRVKTDSYGYRSYCIDTDSQHYALIKDEKVEIKET